MNNTKVNKEENIYEYSKRLCDLSEKENTCPAHKALMGGIWWCVAGVGILALYYMCEIFIAAWGLLK